MLTVKTIQKIERETTLVVPCFFKEKGVTPTYLGILDEATVAKIYDGDSYTLISQGTPDMYSGDIETAFNKWEEITEEEFYNEYCRVMKSIKLAPYLTCENMYPDGAIENLKQL